MLAGSTNSILNSAIELIENYKFPAPNLIENQNTFTAEDQFGFIPVTMSSEYFSVAPHHIVRANSSDDITRFCLTLNKFYTKHNTPVIDYSILPKPKKENTKSLFYFFKILRYINIYKIRSICAFLLIIIAIIFLPQLAFIFKNYYFLNLIGFGNSYSLVFYGISFAIPIVNLFANIIDCIKKIKNNKNNDLVNSTEKTDKTITEPTVDEKIYLKIKSRSQEPFLQKAYREKPLGIIWHLPLVEKTIDYIDQQYKKYCNWYFSYIQRNPFGFTMYIAIRGVSLFSKKIPLPFLGKKMFNAYFDMDKAVDGLLQNDLDPVSDTVFSKKSVPQKIADGEYIEARRNINGTFTCTKYISGKIFHINTLSAQQIEELVQTDPCTIFYKTSHQSKAWKQLTDKYSFSSVDRFAIPSNRIKEPSQSDRLLSLLSIEFISSFLKQFIVDIIKFSLIIIISVLIYIPLNKILLSAIYFTLFIPNNLIERTCRFFNFTNASNKLLKFEQKLGNCYYCIYFNFSFAFNKIKSYIDNKNINEFEIAQTIATLRGQTTPYMSWLNKYKASKSLLTRSRDIGLFLERFSDPTCVCHDEIEIENIINKTRILLQAFYTSADAMYKEYVRNPGTLNFNSLKEKLNLIDKYIAIINLYMTHKDHLNTSFISKEGKINEIHLYKYILAILEIKSQLFLIENANKQYTSRINLLLTKCKEITSDHAKNILGVLRDFETNTTIAREIIHPCIHAYYLRVEKSYGEKTLAVINHSHDLFAANSAVTPNASPQSSPQRACLKSF